MRFVAVVALAAVSAVAQSLVSPALETRSVTFRSTADGSEQTYGLYVPKSLDASAKAPLLITLHPEETSVLANMAQVFGVPGSPGVPSVQPGRGPRPLEWNMIVAAPSGRGTMGFTGIAEQDVYDVLEDVKRRYGIDEDRIYLTGISMGGGAALRLTLTRPDLWAAVVPICPSSQGGEELAPNAMNVPIRLYQGELDPLIPASSSRAWQRRLLDAGAPAEYIEYPEVRHNAWNYAYRDRTFPQWLASHRRNANPARIRLITSSYQHASAYWLRIDGLTPGLLASVDARRTAPSQFTLETHNADGLSVAPAAIELPGTVTIDGDVLRLKPGAPLSFIRRNGHWVSGLFDPQGKRPGLEGPIAAAVSTGHIYVYGTADHPSERELEARRGIAQQAAAWSSPRARNSLTLPVKADSELTASELESSNLVLFGNRDTNLVVRRYEAALPLALAPGAADFGLLFVAPQARRLLLVSSGLPWWTGAEAAARPSNPFVPPNYNLLASFQDLIVFKGSLQQVVIEARFDRNWKVPADLSAKLLATGTVTIQR